MKQSQHSIALCCSDTLFIVLYFLGNPTRNLPDPSYERDLVTCPQLLELTFVILKHRGDSYRKTVSTDLMTCEPRTKTTQERELKIWSQNVAPETIRYDSEN